MTNEKSPAQGGEMPPGERAASTGGRGIDTVLGAAPAGNAAQGHTTALTALQAAKQFISNGIEFGYIRMPEASTDDPAHLTPKLIDGAIALLTSPRAAGLSEGWKLVPIERSYDMRIKALIAFNTTEKETNDRDDALDAAHRAMLDAAPAAPVAPYSAPFTTDVPQCCGDPENCADPCHAQAPAAPVAELAPDQNTELARMTRMFHAACAELGLINEALGLDPDDGGAEPILDAIQKLKDERDQWADAGYAAQAVAAPVADNETTLGECVSVLLDRTEAAEADAFRYRFLRDRPLDTIKAGGVFAGMTPENVVLNGADLDAAIDTASGVKFPVAAQAVAADGVQLETNVDALLAENEPMPGEEPSAFASRMLVRAAANSVRNERAAVSPATAESCAHDYVRSDRVCTECGEKTATAYDAEEMRDAAMRTVQAMGLVYSKGSDRWRPQFGAAPADAGEAVAPDSIAALIARHAEELDRNDYAYFELAYTRQTGWMAWITDKPLQGPVLNPDRKVLARGQGATPAEACRDALDAAQGAQGGKGGE